MPVCMEAQVTEWKTIDSAPRDGTRVDLWVPGIGRVTDAAWQKADHVPLYGWHHQAWYDPEWPEDGREWVEPTHWMPIPEPPA